MTIDEVQRNIKHIQKEMLDYLFNISVVKEIKLEDVDKELKKLNKTKKIEIYEIMMNVYLVQISHHKDKLKEISLMKLMSIWKYLMFQVMKMFYMNPSL